MIWLLVLSGHLYLSGVWLGVDLIMDIKIRICQPRRKKGKNSMEYTMSNSHQLTLQLCRSSILVFHVELSALLCGWSIVLSFGNLHMFFQYMRVCHKSTQQETCNNTSTLNSFNSHGPHQFRSQGGINVVQAPRSSPKFL